MVRCQLFSNFAQAAETATLADQVPEHKRGGVSGIVGAATPVAILAGAIMLAVLPNDFLRFVVPAHRRPGVRIIFVFVLKDKVRTNRADARRSTFEQIFGSFVFNPRKHPDFGWAGSARP